MTKKTTDDFSLVDTVIGAAKIEHVQSLNGNAVQNTGVPLNRYMNMKVIDHETGEEKGVNEASHASPYTYKYIVNLDDKPVIWDQVEDLNPKLRATKGLYMIKFTPKRSGDYRKGRPFKIGQDLIRWDIRVSGVRYWHYLCSKVPELAWLERNSTLTDRMFDIAARHAGMSFWFSVKWEEYEEKIEKQLAEMKNFPSVLISTFGSYKSSFSDYDSSKDKAMILRGFNDILKEINDAERHPEVKKEMLDAVGEEYARSRKNLHDPVTGQFIKKNHEEE